MRTPSAKQKKVAKMLIENSKSNKPLTKGEIVEKSGYGVSMKTNPQVIINSDGVKQALTDFGFNVDNAKKVTANIMLDETKHEHARLKAADMVFKVHGSYVNEAGGGNTVLFIQVSEAVVKKNALNMTSDTSRETEQSSGGLTPIQSS